LEKQNQATPCTPVQVLQDAYAPTSVKNNAILSEDQATFPTKKWEDHSDSSQPSTAEKWHCPSLGIALARMGGLRCPSEGLRLKWSDVHWDMGQFFVRSPKTERYQGKEGRMVPIFCELKEELEALYFSEDSEQQEFVVNLPGYSNREKANIGPTFGRIVEKAGLLTIERPFDNMRMSRSNEVYRKFGAFAESQWIGHSSRVRADHYLMLTDEDFKLAAQWKTPALESTGPVERTERKQGKSSLMTAQV